MKNVSVDFNGDFIKRMLGRIEWAVLYDAASSVNNYDNFDFIAY